MPKVAANGISLEYDDFGRPEDAPLLLIMGLGAQMIRWSASFCQILADQGFHVIRFDNRDAGLSTHFSQAPVPDLGAVVAAVARGETPDVPYTLYDMADDAVGLLDALGIDRAHIVGASMGGMIAQLVASEHPARVLSLTSIMSNTGNPATPRATPEAMGVLANRPPNPFEDEAGFIAHSLASARVIGSPGFEFDEAAVVDYALTAARRAYDPPSFGRQMAAVTATGDRRARLNTITAPTLVIHGDADTLVPLAAGQDTADNIPGARLIVHAGMGHDIPPALYLTLAQSIAANAARAEVDA